MSTAGDGEEPTARVQSASGTEAAGRVADVLLLLAKAPGAIGVSEIARELGLSKAVVHRILQSLASRALVRIDPGTREYHLGPGAISLGARAMQDFDLRQAAGPALRRLRELTQETTTLSALMGDSRIYVDQYESPQEIKMMVPLGRPYPLHAGASSRAILAFLPPDFAEAVIFAGLRPLTSQTVVDADELRRQLEGVRRSGCAISRGERQEGAGSVAAPIFGAAGRVLGAISACGPITRFSEVAVGRHIPLVRAAAEQISQASGLDRPYPAGAATPGHLEGPQSAAQARPRRDARRP